MWIHNLFQAVENDLKIAAKARKDVENQAQRMLAQGMETQVTWSRCPFQLLKSMTLPHPPPPPPRSMDPLSIIVRIWICFLNKGVLKDRFLCSRKSRSIRRMEHFFRFVAFLGLYTFLGSNYLLFRRVISQKLHRWIPPLFFPVRSNIESSGRPCWLDLDRKKWYIRL